MNTLDTLKEAYDNLLPKEEPFRCIRFKGSGTEEFRLQHGGLPPGGIRVDKRDLDALVPGNLQRKQIDDDTWDYNLIR